MANYTAYLCLFSNASVGMVWQYYLRWAMLTFERTWTKLHVYGGHINYNNYSEHFEEEEE